VPPGIDCIAPAEKTTVDAASSVPNVGIDALFNVSVPVDVTSTVPVNANVAGTVKFTLVTPSPTCTFDPTPDTAHAAPSVAVALLVIM
jgi:hypothetical protein